MAAVVSNPSLTNAIYSSLMAANVPWQKHVRKYKCYRYLMSYSIMLISRVRVLPVEERDPKRTLSFPLKLFIIFSFEINLLGNFVSILIQLIFQQTRPWDVKLLMLNFLVVGNNFMDLRNFICSLVLIMSCLHFVPFCCVTLTYFPVFVWAFALFIIYCGSQPFKAT